MPKTKLAITVESRLIDQLDELVARGRFPNRSQAIETAIADTLERLGRSRLARECANLDASEERQLAEEGLSDALDQWPAY